MLRIVDEYSPRVLAVILVLLAAGTVGYIYWSVERFGDFVQCQAEWSQDLLEYEVTANEAAVDELALARFEDQVVDRLIRELLDPEIGDEEAISTWRKSRETITERRVQLQEDRKSNPLPEPPLAVCDGGAIEDRDIVDGNA